MIETRRVADAGRAAAVVALIVLLVVPALAATAPGGYRSDGPGGAPPGARLAATTETWIYLAMSRLMAKRLAEAAG